LKPENILIIGEEKGQYEQVNIKIADFGLSVYS